MRLTRRLNNSRGTHFTATVVLAAAALGFGGCCCAPDFCEQEADYIIVIGTKNGECVVCPGDNANWNLEPGATINFVNMTKDTVEVKAGLDAYAEGHIFEIEKCSSTVRTVTDLPEGVDSRTILHDVKCGGDEHGGPKVVVTEPGSPGGNS